MIELPVLVAWCGYYLYWMLSYLGNVRSVPATLIFIGPDPVIIGTKHNFQSLLWLSFLAAAGAKYSRDF